MDGLKRYVNDDRFRVDGDKNMRLLAFAFTIVFVWTGPDCRISLSVLIFSFAEFDFRKRHIPLVILLHEKFLQSDWLRAVLFQLNLKYLHVKIIDLLRVVV